MGLDVYVHDRAKATKVVEDEGTEDESTYHKWQDGFADVELRSSYNDGGFNHIVQDLTGDYGFYWIFEPLEMGEEYEIAVRGKEKELEVCRLRAEEIRVSLTEAADGGRFFTCFDVDFPTRKEQTPTDRASAMTLFREQLVRQAEMPPMKGPDGEETRWAYTNGGGYFSPDGTSVHAIMLGVKEDILARWRGTTDALLPCAYIVIKHEKDSADYYIDQADRAVKMCDLLLEMLEDPTTDPVIIWSA